MALEGEGGSGCVQALVGDSSSFFYGYYVVLTGGGVGDTTLLLPFGLFLFLNWSALFLLSFSSCSSACISCLFWADMVTLLILCLSIAMAASSLIALFLFSAPFSSLSSPTIRCLASVRASLMLMNSRSMASICPLHFSSTRLTYRLILSCSKLIWLNSWVSSVTGGAEVLAISLTLWYLATSFSLSSTCCFKLPFSALALLYCSRVYFICVFIGFTSSSASIFCCFLFASTSLSSISFSASRLRQTTWSSSCLSWSLWCSACSTRFFLICLRSLAISASWCCFCALNLSSVCLDSS